MEQSIIDLNKDANYRNLLRKLNGNGEKPSMDKRLEEEAFNKMKKQADVWEEEK